LTGLHQSTVLSVLGSAGSHCERLIDVQGLDCEAVQVDELFGFVGFKERQNKLKDPMVGEQYTYLGINAKTKFIINAVVGKRDEATTELYIEDLKKRVKTPFQLTTDGFYSYFGAGFPRTKNWFRFALDHGKMAGDIRSSLPHD
jgi:hypothetical protein